MNKNVIAFIISLILPFIFLQGCRDPYVPWYNPDHGYDLYNPPYLEVPRLMSPLNNTTKVPTQPTFSWYLCRNAKTSRLQVSKDSLFENILYDTIGIERTNKIAIELNYLTKYYWRVNATDENGTSEWSGVWKFITVTLIGYPCPRTPTVGYEGKTYNTVQIGSQCWLKENLNVGTMIRGSYTSGHNGIIEKYCYHDSSIYCDIYGGYYQWKEAMEYVKTEGARGICPMGWHIPSHSEFETLSNTILNDGNSLKAVGQGSGTDNSGFSALLAGSLDNSGNFGALNSYARFWSSTDYYTLVYSFGVYESKSDIYLSLPHNVDNSGYNIRCIKN
jgi:uncharacterized protein (TIGR02145 family)